MATTNKLFTLTTGNTGNLSISGTSATVALPTSFLTRSEDSIRLVSTTDCYVRLTNGSGTAVTTDAFLPGGLPEAFSIPTDATHLSAISTVAGTINYAVNKGA